MTPLLFQSLLFILATGFVLGLTGLHISVGTLQEISGLILLLLLLLINRLFERRSASAWMSKLRQLFTLLTALLVQLTVLSTGGIFSPFLILIHLYTLGAGLLLGFGAGMVFLCLTLISLVIDTLFDPHIIDLIRQDPGTVLLYAASFVAIVPLIQILARQYHSKEQLSKALTRQIAAEESILGNLNEMVLVTDPQLRILSVNEAVERTLHLSAATILHRPLLDVLYLKDAQGQLATPASLNVSTLTADQMTRIIPDLTLHTKNHLRPRHVTIQIQPLQGAAGQPANLSFIVSDANAATSAQTNQAIALARHQANLHHLTQQLAAQPELQLQLQLIAQAEQDLFTLTELNNHPIQEQQVLLDLAQLTRQSVDAVQPLAQALHASLSLELPDFGKTEIAPLIPAETAVSPDHLTSAFYTVPADIRWTGLILQDMFTLAILLTASADNAASTVTLARADTDHLQLRVSTTLSQVDPSATSDIFQQNYGQLATKLRLGSGLEGYLAQTIATQLNLPLTAEVTGSHHLILSLTFSKRPSK